MSKWLELFRCYDKSDKTVKTLLRDTFVTFDSFDKGIRDKNIVDDYLFEERAAIMEYDGNMSREEAEAYAAIDIKTVKKQ